MIHFTINGEVVAAFHSRYLRDTVAPTIPFAKFETSPISFESVLTANDSGASLTLNTEHLVVWYSALNNLLLELVKHMKFTLEQQCKLKPIQPTLCEGFEQQQTICKLIYVVGSAIHQDQPLVIVADFK